jgi:hypothetical protein
MGPAEGVADLVDVVVLIEQVGDVEIDVATDIDIR